MNATQPARVGSLDHLKEEESFLTGKLLFSCLLVYFGLQVLLRTLLSSSADLDESEQLLLCQGLSWGYGPQPPLYSWLQSGMFLVFGQSILALSLFKNVLLFGACAFTYVSAQLITRSGLCASAATLSLFYLPQFVWESQRDLTHTVLASTMAVGMLVAFLKVHQGRRIWWYIGLGAFAGFGVLAKYNFSLWIAGLLIAALSMKQFRSVLTDKRIILSVAVCLLLVLPNLLWIFGNPDAAFSTASKFRMEPLERWPRGVWAGIRTLLGAVGAFTAPLVVLHVLLRFRPRRAGSTRPSLVYETVLGRTLLTILSLLVFSVLCFQVTGFRERWFLPVFVFLPVLVIAFASDRVDGVAEKWMAGASCAAMVAVIFIMPGRVVFAESLGREQPLNLPYRELAAGLSPLLPDSVVIVAESSVLGGNLRLALPDRPVTTPELAALFEARERNALLVWDARQRDPVPEPLRRFAVVFAKSEKIKAQPQYVSATYKYHRSKQMRLGFVAIQRALPD